MATDADIGGDLTVGGTITVEDGYVPSVPGALGTSTATEAAIRSLIATALAAGGSWDIYLPDAGSTGITLTSPLPVVSGIRYIGQFPTFTHSGDVPDNDVTFTGGTWFKGDGTFTCFQAQSSTGTALDADKGSADDNFTTTGIKEAAIIGVGIQDFNRGISIGAANQCGLLFGRLQDIVFNDIEEWGMHLENFQHCEIGRIYSFECLYGQLYKSNVAQATLAPGNSTLYELFDNPTSNLTTAQRRKHRGIVFEAADSANLNELDVSRAQVNNFSKTVTTYTTATGGSGSFTLQAGKGSELEVGMPVKFTHAGGNGNITTGITYFIESISTDTVTVSATMNGSAIAGSFNTSTAFTTYGWGNLLVLGGTSGTVTNSHFDHLDLEGVCQSAFVAENMSGCVVVINEVFANPGGEQHIVLRTSQPNQFKVTNTFTTDIDGSSVQCQFFGTRTIGDCKQNTGQWFGRNATSSRFTLGIGSADVSVRAGNFEQKEPSGGQFVYSLSGIGQRVHGNYGAADTTTLNAGQAGYVYCTTSGAGAITWNLPTISDAVVGLTFKVRNNRAGGAGATLTLTAATGQPINNISGKLSVLLAAPSGSDIAGVYLVACSDGSSGFFWDAVLETGASIP